MEADSEDFNLTTQSACTIKHPMAFRDVEESLERYNGEGRTPVTAWLQNLEDMNVIFGWSDQQLLVYGRQLLCGAAKKFILSQRGITSWKLFKSTLIQEFQGSINSKDIHDELRQRKKNNNESCREYLYEIINIDNRINLEPESVIHYVIEGIQDNSPDKLILRGATTIDELKRKLQEYEKIKQSASRPKMTFDNKRKIVENSPHGSQRQIEKGKCRCFNCGKVGHEAKSCPSKDIGPRCFKCREYGHLAKLCPKEEDEKNQKRKAVMTIQDKKVMNVAVKLEDATIEALVDTGSSVNLIRKDVCSQQMLRKGEITDWTLEGLGGFTVKPIAKIEDVQIEISGEKFTTSFYVVLPNIVEMQMVLRIELLKQVELLVTPQKIEMRKLPIKEHKNNDKDVKGEAMDIMLIETEEDELSVDIDPKYRDRIRDIIRNYKPVKSIETPIETKIILTDEIPVFERPRRLAPLERKILDEQIQKWLAEGIITESTSEYASPVVIVRKKCGAYRVCIDYRRLNKKVIKDRYPMPLLDEQLNRLAKARIFSTLDLENGFFHVPVMKESRKYTAFITPENQYEFNKTLFGFCNSPASFGRFVSYVFRDLIREGIVINYVDDLIIPAMDEEAAIQRLERVLEMAEKMGCGLNVRNVSL